MIFNNYDSYKYLRLAHVTALCFGLPYTRRKIKENFDPDKHIGTLSGIQ